MLIIGFAWKWVKAELVEHQRYLTHDAATRSIGDYIDASTTSSGDIRFSTTSIPSSSNCVPFLFDKWHSQVVH